VEPTPIPQPTNTPVPLPPATPIPTVTPGGGNVAPLAPQDLYPANGAVNQPVNITLSGVYQDANADPGSMRFYWANGTPIGTDSSVDPGTRGEVSVNGLANNTTYQWYAIANDGTVDGPQSATVGFTTTAATAPTPTFTPVPADPTIDPNSYLGGVIGNISTITGANFGSTTGTVAFYDGATPVNAVITGWTDTVISYRVPNNSNFLNNEDLVPVTITTTDSKTVSSNFIVMAPTEKIYDTSVNPPSGSRFSPADITMDSNNHVFIAAADMEKIAGFDFELPLTNLFFSQQYGSAPLSLEYCFSNNKIYTHYRTTGFYLDTTLNNEVLYGDTGQLNQAGGLVVNRNTGELLVTDIGNIERFSLNGTYLGNFPWGYNTPTGIAADSNGDIYVGDYNNDLIKKMTSTGTAISQWYNNNPEDLHIFETGGKIFLLTTNTMTSGPNAGKSMLHVYYVSGNNKVLVAEYVFGTGQTVGGLFVYQNPTNPNDANNGTILFTCGNGEILASVF